MRFRRLAPFEMLREFPKFISRVAVVAGVVAAAPIEEDLVDAPGFRGERADERANQFPVVAARPNSYASKHRGDHCVLKVIAPAGQQFGQLRSVAKERQASDELRKVPMDCF